jgi:hypothetical protein
LFPARGRPKRAGLLAGLLPPKWVPNAAEAVPESHDGHFGFCPAKSQLCRGVVKPQRGKAADCAFPGLGRGPVTG